MIDNDRGQIDIKSSSAKALERATRAASQPRAVGQNPSAAETCAPFEARKPQVDFRTPRSAPHFTTQPRVQPNTERMQ